MEDFGVSVYDFDVFGADIDEDSVVIVVVVAFVGRSESVFVFIGDHEDFFSGELVEDFFGDFATDFIAVSDADGRLGVGRADASTAIVFFGFIVEKERGGEVGRNGFCATIAELSADDVPHIGANAFVADLFAFAFGVVGATRALMRFIGFAANGADFEASRDIGNCARAELSLAIESIGVVEWAILRRSVDVLVKFFGDPFSPPRGFIGDLPIIFDVDNVVGVLIPDVSGGYPTVEPVFEDHDVELSEGVQFTGCAANFV